jgi:hypothetical protein
MMMTGGGTIPGPTARRILGRLKKKKTVCMSAAEGLGIVLATVAQDPFELASRLRSIEFAKSWANVDLDNWKDLHGYVDSNGRNRKGVVQQVVGQAETGARWAGDIHDVLSRRAAESARVGKFKITENSPNTARITVGPDQRERRKKYMWERIGVQRQIAAVGLAAALYAGHKASKAISSRGFKNIVGEAKEKVAGAIGLRVEPHIHIPTMRETADQFAAHKATEELKRQSAAQKTANTISQRFGGKGESTYVNAHYHKSIPGLEVPHFHPEAGAPVLKTNKKGEQYHKLMRVRKSKIPGVGETPIVMPDVG